MGLEIEGGDAVADMKTYEIDVDSLRRNLLGYTKRAFQMIPKIDRPNILDIGCGSGTPTMELARLSGGQIIGLDIDQKKLDKLELESQKVGLTDRIHTVNCSMMEMSFKDAIFDIIWAEGSISTIGFKSGIRGFKRLLKPCGFLVVHDELKDLEEKFDQIASCGYILLGYFILSKEVWWTEYYEPMKKQLDGIRIKDVSGSQDIHELDYLEREIEDFKRNPDAYQSVFFVMQKI